MLNLHVHWGTPQAGEDDVRYDNDRGHKNSYVYDIVKVVDPHTLRLHMPAKVSDQVSYSIGRRSYGKFRVSNCEFFLLDTRGDRQMHDVKHRDKPGLSMIGTNQRGKRQEGQRYVYPEDPAPRQRGVDQRRQKRRGGAGRVGDHAVKAEARVLQRGLILRLRKLAARFREMLAVDRRREAVNIRMPVLLRFV